jgi:acyl-coenzyme A thioesterase PaaI-like protein
VASTLTMWRRLSGRPLGKRLFSAAVMARAPYFGTIMPTVEAMTPGRCVVRAPKWWGVHNHIGTFHAIAACNLAEIAMGMLAEATVPPTHRWIPKGMTVAYLAKATTSLRAHAEIEELPEFGDDPFELTVPVSIRDAEDKEVVHADITIWITRKAAATVPS